MLPISSGSSDRAELRTSKARDEAQAENGTVDPLRVATEARIYYNKIMRRDVKRPKKILAPVAQVPFLGYDNVMYGTVYSAYRRIASTHTSFLRLSEVVAY